MVYPSEVLVDGELDSGAHTERLRREGEEAALECNRHGIYANGACYCKEGWRGAACQLRTCLNECSGRGACVAGQCQCAEGFAGADCSEAACPNKCAPIARG